MKQSTRYPRLPLETRKVGTALFDQQTWCWGQDIQRPEGNLLVAYGLTRQRSPETIRGSSAYTWSDAGSQKLLSGWLFLLRRERSEGVTQVDQRKEQQRVCVHFKTSKP
jgi:hypothetical protein